MTAKDLCEAEHVVFDQVILETRRGTHGRYWSCIRTGLIVVSDDALTEDRNRLVDLKCRAADAMECNVA